MIFIAAKTFKQRIPKREAAKKIDESGLTVLPKKFYFINLARVEKLVKKKTASEKRTFASLGFQLRCGGSRANLTCVRRGKFKFIIKIYWPFTQETFHLKREQRKKTEYIAYEIIKTRGEFP